MSVSITSGILTNAAFTSFVNIAVLANETNRQEAEEFLSKLCQKDPVKSKDGKITFEYGAYKEFNISFDLIPYSNIKDLSNMECLKNYLLFLPLLDTQIQEQDIKENMISYLKAIKKASKEAFIIYAPLNADKLNKETTDSYLLLNRIANHAVDIERAVLSKSNELSKFGDFSEISRSSQFLSCIPILDRYIPNKFLEHVYKQLTAMHDLGRLMPPICKKMCSMIGIRFGTQF